MNIQSIRSKKMERWTLENMPSQTGRVVIVTGANSGLGYESALAFAQKGATVIMACRNTKKGQAAYDDIMRQVPSAKLDLMRLDLGNLASVRDFAAAFRAKYSQVDILLNNAGVMAIPRAETPDGFEMQFGVNHLGHFALTGLLLDMLLATPKSRIVSVSSGAHRIGDFNFEDLQRKQNYTRYGAYGQSKLANVLFMRVLQKRLEAIGSETISTGAHPGYSATNLQETSASTSNSGIEQFLYGIANNIFAQSQAQGALPQLYAATAPEVNGGRFFGPHQWRMRGYPAPEKPSDRALDDELAERLWQASEDLTGVKYEAFEKVMA
jgi:protochlorophyllide reductase